MFRTCGIVAALVIPIGGVAIIGSGVAGAATTKAAVVANITGLGTVTCPSQVWATLAVNGKCHTTTGTGHLKASVSAFTKVAVVTNHALVNPDILVTLIFTSCHITITAPAARPVPLTQSGHVYSATITLTNGATPLPAGVYHYTSSGLCPTVTGTVHLTITTS